MDHCPNYWKFWLKMVKIKAFKLVSFSQVRMVFTKFLPIFIFCAKVFVCIGNFLFSLFGRFCTGGILWFTYLRGFCLFSSMLRVNWGALEGIIYDILVIQIMCLYLKLFRYTKESKAVKNIQQIVNLALQNADIRLSMIVCIWAVTAVFLT